MPATQNKQYKMSIDGDYGQDNLLQEFTGYKHIGEAIRAFTLMYGYQPIHTIKTISGWQLGPIPQEKTDD